MRGGPVITKNEKPFVNLLGVPFDDTDVIRAIIRAGIAEGVLAGPLDPPTDAELDRFEATGELAPRHAALGPIDDKEARMRPEFRQRAVNSCAPKYRRFVQAMIIMADMLPAISDALDMATNTGSTERTYTIDQLRKAWGAGVHAAKDGRV
jgi:hypothetical protein